MLSFLKSVCRHGSGKGQPQTLSLPEFDAWLGGCDCDQLGLRQSLSWSLLQSQHVSLSSLHFTQAERKWKIPDHFTALLSTLISLQSLEPKEDWLFCLLLIYSAPPHPRCQGAASTSRWRSCLINAGREVSEHSPSGWVVLMLKAAMKGFGESHFPFNACLVLQTIVLNLFCILEADCFLSFFLEFLMQQIIILP